jgi:hypothetical protein
MIHVMPRIALAIIFLGAAAAHATEVYSPRAGETLHGGSFAQLTWSPGQLPSHADEWEAFLSIDGGAHYAFRITPHLNLNLHSVTWLVPNVDAREARILIRVGDEKHERHFESAFTFAIVRDAADSSPPVTFVGTRAEAAREGDEPVVAWAEGDRSGTRVAQVAHVDPPGAMNAVHSIRSNSSLVAAAPKSSEAEARQTDGGRTIPQARRRVSPGYQLRSAALLLLCTRLNV